MKKFFILLYSKPDDPKHFADIEELPGVSIEGDTREEVLEAAKSIVASFCAEPFEILLIDEAK